MTNSNSTIKAIILPYVHAIILPIVIFISFGNPLLGLIYLVIPGIIYTTIKTDKYLDFMVPALMISAMLAAGWADAVPIP